MTSTLTERSPRAESNGLAGASPGRLRFLGYTALAALAYIPMLLTAPGRVVADTKSYLYLDPGRLLERAPSMWDPNIGLGTVTHQNIGYLFPMGPYYWLTHTLGVPAWVSQRLWLGTHLALRGVRACCISSAHCTSRAGRGGRGARVHALAVHRSTFAARMSVILLPWAGLPCCSRW